MIGNGKTVNHKDRLVVETIGKRTLESKLFHLGIELEAVIARFRAEAVTAVAPNRISDTAGTGTAESFLLERLLAASGNFRTCLDGCRSRTVLREESNDSVMNGLSAFVEFKASIVDRVIPDLRYAVRPECGALLDRKSTRLNSSHRL